MAHSESITGNLVIDSLQDAQTLLEHVPDLEHRIAKASVVLRFFGAAELRNNTFEISAFRAFAGSDEPQEPAHHAVLEGVQLVGRVERFPYLHDEAVPIDQLAVKVVDPLVVGLNPRNDLGYDLTKMHIPILDIMTFVECRVT